jgi:hypothetical protein
MKHVAIREQLNELYGSKCMLTNIKGMLSYHHLMKREFGGGETVANGAMIDHHIHNYIHNELELYDVDLFDLVNECIDLYKKCLDGHLIELQEQFESECIPIFQQKRMEYQSRRRR